MKFTSVLLVAAAALTSAAPTWDTWKGNSNCLTAERAAYIVDRSIVFLKKDDLAAAEAAGNELYALDFYQTGDSINSLRQAPLGSIVEPNGVTYIENTLSSPPIPVINTLAILNNCTHISWHWQFYGIGGPQAPFKNRINGISLIQLDVNRSERPVVYQNVEFNSYAWAQNTGFTIELPTTGPFADPDA